MQKLGNMCTALQMVRHGCPKPRSRHAPKSLVPEYSDHSLVLSGLPMPASRVGRYHAKQRCWSRQSCRNPMRAPGVRSVRLSGRFAPRSRWTDSASRNSPAARRRPKFVSDYSDIARTQNRLLSTAHRLLCGFERSWDGSATRKPPHQSVYAVLATPLAPQSFLGAGSARPPSPP